MREKVEIEDENEVETEVEVARTSIAGSQRNFDPRSLSLDLGRALTDTRNHVEPHLGSTSLLFNIDNTSIMLIVQEQLQFSAGISLLLTSMRSI